MSQDNENAAILFNFASEMYQRGIKEEKDNILLSLPKRFADLHNCGDLHIHDLEGYGKVYNCCTPDLYGWLVKKTTAKYNSSFELIMDIFESTKVLIMNIAFCQTGGIGFANFDIDISKILTNSNVDASFENISFLNHCIREFICWINKTHTRYCREPYYVTLNIGLDTTFWGRELTRALLEAFKNSPSYFSRPNIVFKVNRTINGENTPNYDLFNLALECTAQRMIPTYLLTECCSNASNRPSEISIMGCRTRIFENLNGRTGIIGRANLACVSINLPRIAIKAKKQEIIYSLLDDILYAARDILIHRSESLKMYGCKYLQYVIDNHILSARNLPDLIKNGTLSIGIIGIAECVEILTGKPPFQSESSQNLAIQIANHIWNRITEFRINTGLNFSLLGTPGELLSGRFCELDKKHYPHQIQNKGYYTNSFHVNVDSNISIFEKIDLESPFHSLFNGGSISYIELDSAPIGNTLALLDVIEYATNKGIAYLGFNFPYDLCKHCGYKGTFDSCPVCGSNNILQLRRISGYIEDASRFTNGKKAELKQRKANKAKIIQ